MDKVGAVMVVGAGIGGCQAALDLADSGFKVYLVEKTTGIGGVMAQLDKTFPTNDCAICILSPKLVEAGRHPNIEIRINSEIKNVLGECGNFEVEINEKSLYIDKEKCTGCGVCGQECPTEAVDLFNEELSINKAASVKYPQAVPLVYAIDRDVCIGCGICRGVCKANAINYDLVDNLSKINVGSIILALGFEEFDPSKIKHLGFGEYKNVVSSIQFERILSASGPYSGHVLRPSDGEVPEKVAFLQCVGSRDNKFGNEYCSSVCCMYTAKEAVIAKEHMDKLEPTIFTMDIRAYGKDFDKYIERAKNDYGVRYIRSRVSQIDENPLKNDLILKYEDENGDIKEETFNMVVLGVGLTPPDDAEKIAQLFGIELNEYGFLKSNPLTPVNTNKAGIFMCGACSSPKDIPETVVEASAAAGQVNTILSSSRNSMVSKKEYPEEKDILNQPPRIGVFICHCGINIGGIVNVPDVLEFTKTLANVVLADRNLYTCSADTQSLIKEKIDEHKLNRVVVASCTPRTHEPLFQETIREAGLNRYLFQMTNIRDQCSWVHMHEPKKATEKAKDLVKMAVAKVRNINPIKELPLDIAQSALIIGGGVSGMSASLNLAQQGFETHIVEKENVFGGIGRKINKTIEGSKINDFLGKLIEKVTTNDKIHVYLNSSIENIDGYVGNFKTVIKTKKTEQEIEHGIIIVATGAQEYIPNEYLYNEDSRVITQLELEEMLLNSSQLKNKTSIAMIQCVGSRNDEHPYCSRVCCSDAIKNAIEIKNINPEIEVIIFYRDIRTYGFKEKYYRIARKKGVIFLRYNKEKPPQLVNNNKDYLKINLDSPKLGQIALKSNLLVLSTGMIASMENNQTLAKMLKVPINEDNFFLEAHVKLRPVDFATEGIFLCGTARGPSTISESISQANSAVSRATTILSKESLLIGGIVSSVDKDLCTGCKICVRICPFNAIVKDEEGYAYVQEALCKGCGLCGASCPERAIEIKHFTNEQILSEIYALGGREII